MKPLKKGTNGLRIGISRTDSIGDVMLTFPLCGWIKEQYPGSEIIFIGRTYTKAVIECCIHVDGFLNYDELEGLNALEQKHILQGWAIDIILHVFPVKAIAKMALKSGIERRVGSTGRYYHFLYCNALVPLSRKNAGRHEALLNIQLAQGFFKNYKQDKKELFEYAGFQLRSPPSIIEKEKFKLILHPRSKGSAREWPLEKYKLLIESLPEHDFSIFISGTAADQTVLAPWLLTLPAHVESICGKFSLEEFIVFISLSDGLIAASTGPLHIAAALGKIALGLYPPIKPMNPVRWAPLGKKAGFLVLDKSCSACRKTPSNCACMKDLDVRLVMKKLYEMIT
jgi:heptosyltransferase-3